MKIEKKKKRYRNFSTANSNGNGQMAGGNGPSGYAAAAIGSVGPTAYPDWSAAQRATFLAAQANSTATAGKFPSSAANGMIERGAIAL